MLSDQSYLAQRDVYNTIIAGIVVVILISGGLLYLVLSHLINCPVALLQSKIDAIAQEDFSSNFFIEWKNEFGTIGKGINQMSENVVSLMDKKVEDEKQKKDLEYQILQSQINPDLQYLEFHQMDGNHSGRRRYCRNDYSPGPTDEKCLQRHRRPDSLERPAGAGSGLFSDSAVSIWRQCISGMPDSRSQAVSLHDSPFFSSAYCRECTLPRH